MGEYLAIKNWVKFQSLRGKGRYIFDYTQQDDEPALAKLSFFQRGVYQEIRRYRGRSGKNMLYDHEFIASSTSARLKDRPRIPQAVRELIACGLLILTNQEVDSAKVVEKEIENEIEKEKKPSARKARVGRVNNTQVARATADPRHSRMKQAVQTWYLEWAGVECPWDAGEGANLARMLKSTPGWLDSNFLICLDHLARSECISKGTRPREWLEKLPKFLHGPLDRFWKPIGVANGSGQVSKAQQRERERDRKWAAIAGGTAPIGLPESGGVGLRPGLEPGENRPVVKPAEDVAKLLPPRNH